MKTITAMLVACLCWAGCSAAEPARIESGKPFRLKPGESALMSDGALRVGFDAVTADSRCPKGEQCVWAGDATVRVWVQRGSAAKDVRELHVATEGDAVAVSPGQQLQLVRLDPYPVGGTGLAKPDYVITLTLTGGAAAPSDR